MEIPLGFYSHNEKNKVCRLKKVLYGLKQFPRVWFGRFSQVMIFLRYRKSQGDHTLFIKHSTDSKITLLLVYVDDMIVIGDDEIEKLILKEKKVEILPWIEVAYSKQGIVISQRKYVLDLLKEIGKLGCKTLGVPIEQNYRIGCKERKLIYLSYTRPDIAYDVSLGKAPLKHIEIDIHFIKEKLNSRLVVTTHVPTRLQVAYVFTKGIPIARFQEFNGKLGMIDIHSPT
ncbi:hypothetical protein CR513_04153, partial [Mucuna pruriens]